VVFEICEWTDKRTYRHRVTLIAMLSFPSEGGEHMQIMFTEVSLGEIVVNNNF